MPTFANTINENEILAKRAECDYAGNDLQTTYATKTEMSTGLASKQDTISDLATIRSGAAAGATAVQPSSLATVATSGSYADLLDKPTIPSVDQNYSSASTNAQSGVAVAQAIASIPSVSYTAGNMISLANDAVAVSTTAGITDIQQVASLPANPVATVLYLIPEA